MNQDNWVSDFSGSDKEFGENASIIDLDQNTKHHIVFVQEEIKLETAVNFSQYVYDKRLITIIGELHGTTFPCEGNSTTIEDYVNDVVNSNDESKILLEYNRNDDPMSTSSIVINNVYNTLKKNNRINHIIPFDERNFFLTPQYHFALYSQDLRVSSHNILSFSQKEIFDRYVTPYYVNNNAFNIDPNEYPPEAYSFFVNTYLPDIDNNFKYLLVNDLPRWDKDKKPLVTKLKNIWKKVTDFYILRELFKNDGTTEIIIILGDSHRVNIQSVMESANFKKLKKISGSKENCVSLFQTYKFN